MDSMRELNTPGKKSRDYRIRVSRENGGGFVEE